MKRYSLPRTWIAECLEDHEIETIDFLKQHGLKVSVIVPANRDHVKTPDVKINGIAWEMKCPTSGNQNSLEHMFDRGLKQSVNMIYDLRKLKGDTSDRGSVPNLARRKLETMFKASRRAKKLWIITKDGDLIKYEK